MLTAGACTIQPPPSVPATPVPPPVAVPEPEPTPRPRLPLPQARAEFVRETASTYGIDPARIESVLANAQIRDSIVKAMSRPAEAKPWRDYRPIFLTDARISGGRAFMAANRDRLMAAQARYGVPAEIITAIIGVETSYGGNTGSYPVVDALYTLAFAYPRTGDPAKAARENQRETFFRSELAQLFALERETGLDITTLKGSYAGAMGMGQFMPSSYRDYAVDGNGDGDRDLFNDLDDVTASIANYFVKKGGWERGGPVAVRAAFDASKPAFEPESLDPVHTVAQLQARGYRPLQPVPATQPATVIRLDGTDGPEYWIVFRNFQAITRYNTSRLYAMAVYQLAEAIAGRPIPPPPASGTDTAR